MLATRIALGKRGSGARRAAMLFRSNKVQAGITATGRPWAAAASNARQGARELLRPYPA